MFGGSSCPSTITWTPCHSLFTLCAEGVFVGKDDSQAKVTDHGSLDAVRSVLEQHVADVQVVVSHELRVQVGQS